MKKKLEADLISIAHRILQMKNKSDVNQLLIETQKLQEKLSVLKFVEDYFGGIKPTISQFEVEEKLESVFEKKDVPTSYKTDLPETSTLEEIIINEFPVDEVVDNQILEEPIELVTEKEIVIEETVLPEKSKTVGFTPAFELDVDFEEEPKKKPESAQISFEDLLGGNYNDTLFVKLEPKDSIPNEKTIATPPKMDVTLQSEKIETATLNETLTKGIKIDLNDRIAFVKHLFGNSNEDYSRVLNQLITYDNFEEAQDFIEEMVKPDYNNWEGKEDYSKRFMEAIEKKFA